MQSTPCRAHDADVMSGLVATAAVRPAPGSARATRLRVRFSVASGRRALRALGAGLVAFLAAFLAAAAPVAAGGLDVVLGQAIFERMWVAGGASTRSADGLGPLYNARSCSGCHAGAGPSRVALEADGTLSGPGLVVRLSTEAGAPDPVYGRQIQPRAVPGQTAEARVTVREVPGAPGDPGPRVEIGLDAFAYGPLASDTRAGLRLGPDLAGRAALDRIDEAAILARADPRDRDGDGISGRPQWLAGPDGTVRLGRFGWRASHADLADQVASAFANDLGLSTPMRPDPAGDCTAAQADCRAARHGDRDGLTETEVTAEMLGLLTAYLQSLDRPKPSKRAERLARAEAAGTPRAAGDVTALSGEAARAEGQALFAASGCSACHVPAMPATGGGTVAAFTDLLLHDMGADLADPAVEGVAMPAEWRTAPLVGLSSGAPGSRRYLHDGRAASVDEAIRWHGGEAERARKAYEALTPDERSALMAYLGDL